jgi:DNA-3-methyladenine glycosylase
MAVRQRSVRPSPMFRSFANVGRRRDRRSFAEDAAPARRGQSVSKHRRPAGSFAVLEPAFFNRRADEVARDLLGKALVRRIGQAREALIITETEGYLGPQDLACHSARGRTPRTEVMFGRPGTLYIYLVYGLHLMLNVVTGPEGCGSAVLIRGAGNALGPGRLGRSLALTLDLNGKAATPETGLWFEERDVLSRRITAGPRIGVDYAGPKWSQRKLRFILQR